MTFGEDLDLKNDIVIDGQKYLLSTVDLGVPCDGGSYETMLFACEGDEVNYTDLYCERYDVREDAEKRHVELVQLLNNGERFWETE